MTHSKYPELSREQIAAALDGDRVAFAKLYRCYEPTVRTAAAAAIRFRADLAPLLEDIVAELWARFLADGCRRLRGYDPDRGPFGYYLRMRAFTIARALAAQHLRQADTVALDDPFLSLFSEGLEGRVHGRDSLEKLYAAVKERLDDVDVALFECVFVQGQTIIEVAKRLDLSRDVAYRRSHRLKDKIQRIADGLFGSGPRKGGDAAIILALAATIACSESKKDVHIGETRGIEEGEHATISFH